MAHPQRDPRETIIRNVLLFPVDGGNPPKQAPGRILEASTPLTSIARLVGQDPDHPGKRLLGRGDVVVVKRAEWPAGGSVPGPPSGADSGAVRESEKQEVECGINLNLVNWESGERDGTAERRVALRAYNRSPWVHHSGPTPRASPQTVAVVIRDWAWTPRYRSTNCGGSIMDVVVAAGDSGRVKRGASLTSRFPGWGAELQCCVWRNKRSDNKIFGGIKTRSKVTGEGNDWLMVKSKPPLIPRPWSIKAMNRRRNRLLLASSSCYWPVEAEEFVVNDRLGMRMITRFSILKFHTRESSAGRIARPPLGFYGESTDGVIVVSFVDVTTTKDSSRRSLIDLKWLGVDDNRVVECIRDFDAGKGRSRPPPTERILHC
ncbi:hypothetical protein FB45DRAFT_877533 [Roridomyces roridus]|uniref:Uncharacterized protein n=1 Tax=Roridomyces roridus TaxID=1738132 RepID=A0AAD7B2P1_9AGAR|nr:hypothetical protein FB45DRAFT_877533 [Roridomyces roridus]